MQPERERSRILAKLGSAELAELQYDWNFWGRPAQLPPSGAWGIWLILAGRGWGKTRTGAEWVRAEVETGRVGRLAIIAETAADARDVLVEGPSGLLSIGPKDRRPLYEPSKRRLTWPNGAVATLFNAVEPDQLRGPQFDAAWCDELAKWRYAQDTWDQLQFGLRLGNNPRLAITTTPRPIPLIKDLVSESGRPNSRVVITRGVMVENAANLATSFIAAIQDRYSGTRLGRQELDAEILDDVPGALWTRATFEADGFRRRDVPEMARVVVAVDPSGTRGEEDAGDSIGIIVAGKGVDGRAYVLADRSCKLSPAGWAKRAVTAYHEFRADRLVAEANFGGAMVESVIRSADENVAYREVKASRGKVLRAEPIAALYEQGRASHIGTFSDLEDQMCQIAGDGYLGKGSPDRVDALVWALTELFDLKDGTAIIEFYRRESERSAQKQPAAGTEIKSESTSTAIRMRSPPGISTAYGKTGNRYLVNADGIFTITDEDDAGPLRAAGFVDA